MKSHGVATTPNNHEKKQSPIKNSKKRINQIIIKQMKTLNQQNIKHKRQ
jgi:hypothetical protein